MFTDKLNSGREVGNHDGGGQQPGHSRGVARVTDPHEVHGGNPTATGVRRQGRDRVGPAPVGGRAVAARAAGDQQRRAPRVDRAKPLEHGSDILDSTDRDGVGSRTQDGCHRGLGPWLDRQQGGEAAQDAGGPGGSAVRPGSAVVPPAAGGVQQRGGAVLRRQRQDERLPTGLPGSPIAFGGTLLRTQILQPRRRVRMDRHRLGMPRGELGTGRPHPGEF